MGEPSTATRLMDDIISRHKLSGFDEKEFHHLDAVRLAVATPESVSFFAYSQLDAYLSTLPIANGRDRNHIYALTTVPRQSGDCVAFTTDQGKLYIADGDGMLIREQIVSKKSLWSVAHARLEGRDYLLACCTDHTIRVFDPLGEPLGVIETPGRVLSIDLKDINGRIKIAGGVQNQPEVYLWDLGEMIAKRDATPQAILLGGQKPAFATKFIDIEGETWILHGCWDKNVYLYRWSVEDSGKVITPRLLFCGSSPIYPIQLVTVQGTQYLLAGTENGDIYGWSLVSLRNKKSPDFTVARLGVRVKCMATAKIDGQSILFAGCYRGRLYIFQLDNLESPQCLATVDTGGSEVRGIDLLSSS